MGSGVRERDRGREDWRERGWDGRLLKGERRERARKREI